LVGRQYWFPEHYASAVQRLRVPLGFALIAAYLLAADPGEWSMTLGLPIALAGLGIRGWAAGHLAKDRALATGGPYALVRNPLYLGTLTAAVGFSIAAGVWWLALLFGILFLLIYLPVMELEEKHLLRVLPGAAEYVERVPLFLPSRAPIRSESRFSWALYMRNEEYKALGAFAIAALFLAWRAGWLTA
jgi:protein-S-isoprenylcysteine O-methyltransferase Ste14